MKINIHAGHNPDGKTACGATGIIKESTQARKVKDYAAEYLRAAGHTVYDCTVNNGTSQGDVLSKIVKKCNAHEADIDVSIHFNSGAGDKKGNGKTTGTEVLVYSENSGAKKAAERTVKKIAALGFKNRGIKVRPDLYVLKNTKAPAMLVECCFVDDRDDCERYKAKSMAKAIAEGITGETAKEADEPEIFRVKVTADLLNVRKGAGKDYSAVKRVKKNKVLAIVKVAGNWGKLKSGAGWINLKYTKRV